MERSEKTKLSCFLKTLPPIEFCCVYGSTLHPNNSDKSSMIDYIIGVADPLKWHSENLKLNRDHYASWMVHLGGAKLLVPRTKKRFGHFTRSLKLQMTLALVCTSIPMLLGTTRYSYTSEFIYYSTSFALQLSMVKYGVVRMHDLVQDILNWQRFYTSGRLQKPVHVLVDNLDVEKLNAFNLRAAIAAALLILPSKFTEEDLYSKICSLSYMGDLRMLFAEDKNKVKKIVQGQFRLFQSMYKPFIEEYEAKEIIRVSSLGGPQTCLSQDLSLLLADILIVAFAHIACILEMFYFLDNMVPSSTEINTVQSLVWQDCCLPAARSLVWSLPPLVRKKMGTQLGEKKILGDSGRVIQEVMFSSREEAARSMQKVLRRTVMVSSLRQAVSGVLAAGGMNAGRYLANKMRKAWKSWT
ncbi:Phosphatidate cytidylyltransferase, mitochondrial [Linum perenne]